MFCRIFSGLRREAAALYRDESGSVSVFMVILLPLYLMIVAVAVDITLLNSQRRYLQSLADLSALSAAGRLPDRTLAVQSGALVAQSGTGLVNSDLLPAEVTLGRFDEASGFIAASSAAPEVDSVRVVLRAEFNPFLLDAFFPMGGNFVSRSAVTRRQDLAALSLRNTAVQANSANSPLLSALVRNSLGLNLTLLNWSGLAGTDLTLSDLAGLVSASSLVSLVTFQDVLDAEVNLPRLMTELVLEGILPASAVSGAPSVNLRLRDILSVSPEIASARLDQPLPDIGLTAQGFLMALAQLSAAQRAQLVSVTTGITAAPLANPALRLGLVDPGEMVIGRISPDQPLTAQAAQVELSAQGELLGLVRISATVQAAAATARLHEVNCRARLPDDIVAVVEVETHPLTLALQVLLLEQPDNRSYSASRPVSYSGQVQQISIRRRDLGQAVPVPNTLSTAELSSALTLSLGVVQQDLTTERNRLGLLGLLVLALLNVVTGLLNSVTNLLANTALLNTAAQSLLDLLGIRVAQAEVVLSGIDCRMALVR